MAYARLWGHDSCNGTSCYRTITELCTLPFESSDGAANYFRSYISKLIPTLKPNSNIDSSPIPDSRVSVTVS